MSENIVNETETQEIETMSNDETTENAVFADLSLWEKVKYIFYRAMDYLYKIRCVCCFTSILATLSICFFFDIARFGNFWASVITVLIIIGWVSGILACPLKMIGNVIKFVGGGFTIGLGFAVVGCVVGAMIGVAISYVMVLIIPAVVTIPYYFNELRYKGNTY